ncbi:MULTISPECIES: tetratricopeptide repeat protein [unclassified Bradyrhizobium]|uniref:tetratricopeptide repeat protein n=1 Tax=unclassified Bradyrhizobium TaxID=2631580 RepID=UPI001FFB147A|nr:MULTISPECIES: tetratricopeptide repeat protein [unclassified Bradyrhizobium]MCK1714025.1 tetratricopeptide repeat protein [Bradyrhizobium sp. 143]MCK1727694.1 tetratricopeptide repeat protein [Bradyrhizobium sp. 142]
MALEDRYGLQLSTASHEAASAYREGVDLMLAGWTGTAETLERAIAADPDFALPHITRARVHAFYQQGDLARQKAAIARELVAKRGTEREHSHVEMLALAIEGRLPEALAATLKHVDAWPRDAVVLSLPLGAFGLFAFSGMADHDRARQELCERVAHHYGEDWWFLTLYGWAMTENGNVARGRSVTERGFGLRRENAHAAHAVLHAMFEDGSIDEADRLVDDWIPSYHRAGILHGHIRWHQALGALEHGDAARALAIYADVLQPSATQAPPLNVITDGASLLWRLSAYGHTVPKALWFEADAAAQKLFPKSSLPFADVHMALYAAATQNREALAARLAAIEQRLADGRLPAGPAVPAICRALAAFADEDYAACVHTLAPVLSQVVRIGGSHAQRELIEDTFIVALMRNGELPRARALLDARLHRRPSLRDRRWQAAMG